MPPLRLLIPDRDHLPDYLAALHSGWSPDNLRPEVGQEQAAEIEHDPDGFLARQADNEEAAGSPVIPPDGSIAPRLRNIERWIWDGAFCGRISFRWQVGSASLPSHVLGHIGCAVVPWKRNRGYATQALNLLLIEVRATGLPHVEITTDVTNLAAQRVIEASGGQLVERFERPTPGGARVPAFRYRLDL